MEDFSLSTLNCSRGLAGCWGMSWGSTCFSQVEHGPVGCFDILAALSNNWRPTLASATPTATVSEINVRPALMCMQMYIFGRADRCQDSSRRLLVYSFGYDYIYIYTHIHTCVCECLYSCLWPWHMWLPITMRATTWALEQQRCATRRAKINESLRYKMPNSGTQSIGKKSSQTAVAATTTTAPPKLLTEAAESTEREELRPERIEHQMPLQVRGIEKCISRY